MLHWRKALLDSPDPRQRAVGLALGNAQPNPLAAPFALRDTPANNDLVLLAIQTNEARGERKQAADCYRKVIEFVRAHPDQYDPEFNTTFERLIAELDPSPTT